MPGGVSANDASQRDLKATIDYKPTKGLCVQITGWIWPEG